MKTFITTMLLLIAGSLTAQTFNETIRKEFSFEKAGNNTLMVQNINGDVKVEGHAGTNIVVEVLRRITGKTQARLEKGKQEIQLGVIDRADTILLYVQGTCTDFGKRPQGKKHSDKRPRWNGWGYDWNNCNGDGDCDKEYDYEMNFTIKVPANTNVLVSTINNGDVEVKGVGRYVLAENVNGGILLQNIAGATYASTINGDVDLDYVGNPPGDSRYYTLNGNIHANFKKGLAAQLTFKSFNGEFYSSIDDIVPMAVSVEKYPKGEGIQYKVNGNRYRVGSGGPLLDFETFNGDVYLKEKEN